MACCKEAGWQLRLEAIGNAEGFSTKLKVEIASMVSYGPSSEAMDNLWLLVLGGACSGAVSRFGDHNNLSPITSTISSKYSITPPVPVLMEATPKPDPLPANLQRATLRLKFPPSYVVVGVYRLCTDESLYKPAWDKCKHGVQRGAIVGFVWTCLTYKLQRRIIRALLSNPSSLFSLGYLTRLSQTATDLSEETFIGFKLPFNLSTYVTILLLGAQITSIITFFLSRNIRIARHRAWDQTVASRGKGPDFWQPYVEEWDVPPIVNDTLGARVSSAMETWAIGVVVKKALLLPLSLYPFVGTFVAAGFKAIGTAQHLHKPYFKAKNMTSHQIAIFIEERKWDYRLFGFAAALLEDIPIIGLAFTISNRIGAAMWAHDLEKRQHYIAGRKNLGRGENESADDRLKAI